MNLILHQFRHELRRARVGLFFYAIVLLGNLAVARGWIGAPELRNDESWAPGGALNMILVLAYWIAFTFAVAESILADSPARRDRFLATRPLPTGSLATAKLLYLALAVLLPAVLVEVISLASAGASFSLQLTGGAERLLLCSVLASAIAAFAAHWKNMPGFLLATAIGFAGVLTAGPFVAWLLARGLDPLEWGRVAEPTFLTILQGTAVLAAGLAFTAWMFSRGRVRTRCLLPSFIPIIAVAGLVLVASPVRHTAYRPASQATIDQILEGKEATVQIVSERSRISMSRDESDLFANCSVTPFATGFPADLELRWQRRHSRWELDGRVVRRELGAPRGVVGSYLATDAVPLSWALARTIQDHLNTSVVFDLENASNWNTGSALTPTSLPYDPHGPLVGKQARHRTTLTGNAFRWEVAADLPLQAGQSATDGESTWEIASLAEPRDQTVRVQLSEKTVVLRMAGGWNGRADSSRWQDLYRFALYLPDQGIAWFGQSQYTRAMPGTSAAKQFLGEIDFQFQFQGQDQETDRSNQSAPALPTLAKARFLVLRSTYVGSFDRPWESPPITLDADPTEHDRQDPNFDEHERWSPAEFALWFHRSTKLTPDLEAHRVQAHLVELFEKIERVDRHINDLSEPAVLYATRFVPRHLEFLLEQVKRAPYRTVNFLITAISLGAQESQRPIILAQLPQSPELAEVVRQRGWDDAARETIVTLTRNDPAFGSRYLPLLLATDDPALDSLVLDTYRANPTLESYRTLRGIPRLEAETDRITRELWKPGRLVLSYQGSLGTLQFGLAQGRPEALEELFTLVRVQGTDPNAYPWMLAQLITNSIHVPKAVRGQGNDWDKVINWAATRQPSDFTFDPVFRRFLLKAANQTI